MTPYVLEPAEFAAKMSQMIVVDSKCEICETSRAASETIYSGLASNSSLQMLALFGVGVAFGYCMIRYSQRDCNGRTAVERSEVNMALGRGNRSPTPDTFSPLKIDLPPPAKRGGRPKATSQTELNNNNIKVKQEPSF